MENKEDPEYLEGYIFIEEGLKDKIMQVGIAATLKLTKETVVELNSRNKDGAVVWVYGALAALNDFVERHGNEKKK